MRSRVEKWYHHAQYENDTILLGGTSVRLPKDSEKTSPTFSKHQMGNLMLLKPKSMVRIVLL